MNTANVLTMTVNLPAAKYPSAEAQMSFYDRLKTRLEAIPGVESIAFAIPFRREAHWPSRTSLLALRPSTSERRPTLRALVISPGYFRTMGAAVLAGREFNDADDASGIPVVIVNQQFATRFWPEKTPRQTSSTVRRHDAGRVADRGGRRVEHRSK